MPKSIVAFGGIAPDHFTLRPPSVSSKVKPGSGPSRITHTGPPLALGAGQTGVSAGRLNKVRNVATSSELQVTALPSGPTKLVCQSGEFAVQISESPTIAMACPSPG